MKFLVQLRADRSGPTAGEPDLAAEVLDVCREIVTDCNSAGLPSVIENLIYELPGEQLSGRAREDAIIAAAAALDEVDIDLLNLKYPGDRRGADASRRSRTAHGRRSAGVRFVAFSDVPKIAFDEGGASGFIAGRSIWREALPLSGMERQRFLDTVARSRLDDLVAVAISTPAHGPMPPGKTRTCTLSLSKGARFGTLSAHLRPGASEWFRLDRFRRGITIRACCARDRHRPLTPRPREAKA